MKSKRSQEGYYMLDHRAADGISERVAQASGLPVGAGRGLFEAPTYTCAHCQLIVVINPLRNRERAYCRGCDHYVCDTCGAIMAQTKECNSFKRMLDEQQEQALKQEQSGGIIVSAGS